MNATARIDSPLGDLLLVGDGSALTGLYPPAHRRVPTVPADPVLADPGLADPGLADPGLADPGLADPVLADAADQLAAYFAGERTAFDLPLAPHGTPFQRAVWEALRTIPYGGTLSYGELARRLGRSTAARAVGTVVGRNPISVIIPCHRVVSATGALTGYAGGLAAKEQLLALEAGRSPVGVRGVRGGKGRAGRPR